MTNTLNIDTLKSQLKSKGGQFFRVSFNRKGGKTTTFIAKLVKLTPKSVTLRNVAAYQNMVVPFSVLTNMQVS